MEKLNSFQLTYLSAKTAYELIAKTIDEEKWLNKEFVEYSEKCTPELFRNDSALFTELSIKMSSVETELEYKYNRWGLFELYKEAERILIEEFKKSVLSKEHENNPSYSKVVNFFEDETMERIRLDKDLLKNFIEIIFKYRW